MVELSRAASAFDGSKERACTSGVGSDPQNERRLRFASVRASVPMADGSTADVDVTWDGSDAPLQVAGNSGTYHFNNGIDRHVVDRCFTTNNNFQQTHRAGPEVAIDGTDVQTNPLLQFSSAVPGSWTRDPRRGRSRELRLGIRAEGPTHGLSADYPGRD